MCITKLSDQELVSQYIKGNEVAFEALVSRHQERVFSYIMMMVRNEDEANDIFQESFIKAINTLKKGTYNEEGKFLPWILRIAHNLVIDNYRKAKRMPTFSGTEECDVFDMLVIEDANAEDLIITDAINEQLKELIELLPDDQRTVLKMRHYCEMSFKEIAEETEVSINTALGRMRYALINMRKMIKERNLIMSV